ncbi:S8 family peptidase [Brevibacillus centrosporus]|uniref:Subtilase family protein n=1 Tax=Brevibacillus centrosporus TaxID=54910 RepID=A0A1I3TPC2_9BACL|nr:S8 family peptidase [Brevibacillus centrosporus]SFJ72460.1 Subtilase family protein [Brevibacillus centrosporus]
MRFAPIVVAVALVGLVVVPYRMHQNAEQEMREPHPRVTSLNASIPRINYIEQVKDIRRGLEKRSHIQTLHHNPRDRSHYIEHEVVVRFSPRPDQKTIDKMVASLDAKIKRDFDKFIIIKSRSLTTKQLMKKLAEHPDSVFAEPNFLLLPNRTPNDPYYTEYQWNLPLIGMEQSWDVSEGSSDVIVAVVDTGVDMEHPEFEGKLVKGYNVLDGSNKPQDDNGHGTHVSGVIAAKTNNNDGIAGMTWKSKLMPVKAIGADGSGSAVDIAQGIYWATDHGADVINLSVGNYTSSAALKEACKYAYDNNVVLVAASGNDASDQPSYPAAYDEVLSVAAVDHLKERADFSNFGDYVDVAAPGVDIPSTYIYSDYASLSGTSMACPHVAALAALVRSVHPDMKSHDVMELIRSSALDLGPPGHDQLYGYGMIDVNRTLRQLHTEPAQSEQTPPTFGGLLNKFLLRLRFGFE